jgi:hypothetical protein
MWLPATAAHEITTAKLAHFPADMTVSSFHNPKQEWIYNKDPFMLFSMYHFSAEANDDF